MGLIDNFLLGAAGRLKPLSVQACRSGGSIILAPRSLESRLFGLPRTQTQRIGQFPLDDFPGPGPCMVIDLTFAACCG